MPSDLDILAAKVAELLKKPKKTHDRRPNINFRLNPEELAVIDAAATARGLCRADLIRVALNTELGSAFQINRDVPVGLRGRRNRKRLAHFSDEKTSVPLRDAATLRHLASRAVAASAEYRQALAEQPNAAALSRYANEGMADSPTPLLSGGKLSR